MKYKTFEKEIDGYRIVFSDHPDFTKNKDVWRRNLWECFLIRDGYFGLTLISKQAFGDENFLKLLPKILLKEIDLAKTQNEPS